MFQLINKIIIHTFYSTENLFVRIYYTIEEIYYVIAISFFPICYPNFARFLQVVSVICDSTIGTFFSVSICMKQIVVLSRGTSILLVLLFGIWVAQTIY